MKNRKRRIAVKVFIIYNVLFVIACNDHIKTGLQFIVLSQKYIKKEDILDRCTRDIIT